MKPLPHQVPFQLVPEQALHAGNLYVGVIAHPRLTAETIFLICDTPSCLEQVISSQSDQYFRRSATILGDALVALIYLKASLPQRTTFYGTIVDPLHAPIFRSLAIQPKLRIFYSDPERTLWDMAEMENGFQNYARKVLEMTKSLPGWSHEQFTAAIGSVLINYPNPQNFWTDFDRDGQFATQVPNLDIHSVQHELKS